MREACGWLLKRPRLSDYHDDQQDDGAELQDEGSETERLDKEARKIVTAPTVIRA